MTPDEVRQALQVTATPVKGTEGEAGTPSELGFWQVGYGYVDLAAAVQLVRSPSFTKDLKARQATADQRVLRSTGYAVRQSDLWTYDAPRASLGGSDSHTYAVTVNKATTHLKVTLSHPSLNQVGVNGFEYVVTVRDANGRIVATTTEADGVGTSSAFVDLRPLRNPSVTYGAFTIEVSGESSLSDPDGLDSDSLLGDTITLQLAQLTPLA
jgi:serine protease AprX